MRRNVAIIAFLALSLQLCSAADFGGFGANLPSAEQTANAEYAKDVVDAVARGEIEAQTGVGFSPRPVHTANPVSAALPEFVEAAVVHFSDRPTSFAARRSPDVRVLVSEVVRHFEAEAAGIRSDEAVLKALVHLYFHYGGPDGVPGSVRGVSPLITQIVQEFVKHTSPATVPPPTVPPPQGLFDVAAPPPQGLFGVAAPPPQGLFGVAAPPPQGLFGVAAPPPQGLFGVAAPPQGLFGVAAPPPQGLFGVGAPPPQGLFGASARSASPQGLFGVQKADPASLAQYLA